jgi:hypothetical protein
VGVDLGQRDGRVIMKSYRVQTRWGGSIHCPSVEQMREALADLDGHDPEHPDTWLEHEDGWGLIAYESGLLVWEAVESRAPPRHMSDVARERVLELWSKLAEGRLDDIEAEPWRPGYGHRTMTEEERVEREAFLLGQDREFYDSLGSERQDHPCQAVSCSRGAVSHSRFCRVHHFEMVRRTRCPFTD